MYECWKSPRVNKAEMTVRKVAEAFYASQRSCVPQLPALGITVDAVNIPEAFLGDQPVTMPVSQASKS